MTRILILHPSQCCRAVPCEALAAKNCRMRRWKQGLIHPQQAQSRGIFSWDVATQVRYLLGTHDLRADSVVPIQ